MKELDFDTYLRGFGYQERVDMKIQLPELFELYLKGEAQVMSATQVKKLIAVVLLLLAAKMIYKLLGL
ncbi:MAG: hypothetical protein WC272_03100 [Sulfurimonas sp.]|jgi:hypothetical protein